MSWEFYVWTAMLVIPGAVIVWCRRSIRKMDRQRELSRGTSLAEAMEASERHHGCHCR